MHVRLLNPNTSLPMTDAVLAAARAVARPDTVLTASHSSGAPATVETHVDEVFGAAGVLAQVEQGERDGVDGYVVACFGDTGLPAARERARGPVVGMTEAALQTAALLAHRFTVITMPPRTIAMTDRVVASLGLGHRCVVRAVDVAVEEIETGAGPAFDAFAREARHALVADGAEAIVLGCAGLTDLVSGLGDALGVPVVDGVAAATTAVEGLLAQGLTTSRANTWAVPTGSPTTSEVWA
ncbi:aspartate/glutamate racemase family protein [Curtobacterium sp. MCBD17_040]|uniref:aspartate/glutamate racemase family protein n=1 Tax=Curtobacterium sp. MCBD17_040 TaxID=2175674 RepID=UPI000DA81048|nr:aspartate/glutamate racemase family protein [Curtobacterium sp. MCBD17_040]WIB65105.1 aspartate/glutamate racemase family protein [Curtobacterium sp. MCBD17_040]